MRDYGVGPDVLAHWRRRAAEVPQDPIEVVRAVVLGGREGLRPRLRGGRTWLERALFRILFPPSGHPLGSLVCSTLSYALIRVRRSASSSRFAALVSLVGRVTFAVTGPASSS